MPRRLLKALVFFSAAAVLVYAALLVLLWLSQRALLYPVPDGDGRDVALAGAQSFALATPDGQRLSAFFVPPRTQRSPSVLFFHGNAQRLDELSGRARRYSAAGYGFMAIAYRGYPGSTGEPSEKGLIIDGLAAFDDLRRRIAGEIILHGLSLGTGVAVAVAAEREAGAVILEAPFASAADVAAERYPMFPVRLLMRDPFRSDRRIASVDEPLLILHSPRDSVIPIHHGRRLFERARAEKRFVPLEDAGHADLFDQGGYEAIEAFLDSRNLRPRP